MPEQRRIPPSPRTLEGYQPQRLVYPWEVELESTFLFFFNLGEIRDPYPARFSRCLMCCFQSIPLGCVAARLTLPSCKERRRLCTRRTRPQLLSLLPWLALGEVSDRNGATQMNRYSLKKKLGDGTYGSVLKAVNRQTGEEVAVKKMKKMFTRCACYAGVSMLNASTYSSALLVCVRREVAAEIFLAGFDTSRPAETQSDTILFVIS